MQTAIAMALVWLSGFLIGGWVALNGLGWVAKHKGLEAFKRLYPESF